MALNVTNPEVSRRSIRRDSRSRRPRTGVRCRCRWSGLIRSRWMAVRCIERIHLYGFPLLANLLKIAMRSFDIGGNRLHLIRPEPASGFCASAPWGRIRSTLRGRTPEAHVPCHTAEGVFGPKREPLKSSCPAAGRMNNRIGTSAFL